jgi:hypothetical protein
VDAAGFCVDVAGFCVDAPGFGVGAAGCCSATSGAIDGPIRLTIASHAARALIREQVRESVIGISLVLSCG